ncbi:hypothetical protein [uncultured Roseobacter sp.]|uniref:hypothetical protein n=1 Tax=uncultured Roseobacter sp. TaxID=114847 RepID=UPI0026293577|nr:hypothetical protein [uncultured Roseobacter sp.]
MSHKKEVATAVGTLACAVGIGFVMQNGEVAELRYGSAPVIVEELKVQSTLSVDALKLADPLLHDDDQTLDVRSITLTSAEVEAPHVIPVFAEPTLTRVGPVSSLIAPTAPEVQPIDVCPIMLSTMPHAAAMVKLSLTAPCLQNERVTVRHNGLEFTETTSASGGLDIAVPALEDHAKFALTFLNGNTVTAHAEVPSIALYERIVVQWQGRDRVQLHAREFGASYGDSGHVWAGAARDVTAVMDGNGGFLSRHGDSAAPLAKMAEVYTYPSAMTETTGAVEISIEAEVTPANCGREVKAQALGVVGGRTTQAQSVSLAIPGCHAVGNFLVLNNPLPDLKVAAN